MRPGYVGLPAGSEKWSEKQWVAYHKEQAEAIGCYYDDTKGSLPVLFASQLVHPRGPLARTSFTFMPWFEHRIVRPFYGYMGEDGLRRYHRAYLFTAKKQAKTTSIAPLIPYHLTLEEIGGQLYSAAGDIGQAALVYNTVSPMLPEASRLHSLLDLKDTQRRIVCHKTNSFYQVLSSEVNTKAGLDTSFVHFDELAFQPNRLLWDILTQGASAARLEPALFATSTAGYDANGICREEWDYAKRVMADPSLDPRLLAVVYELPEGASWKDESAWHFANPSMGSISDVQAGLATSTIEGMRSEFKKAVELPSNENIFRMMRCNQWVSQLTRWMPMEAWDALADLPVADFAGRDWFGGIDLSSTLDLTSWFECAQFGAEVHARWHFWLPSAGIEDKERRDQVPYRQYAKQGFLTLTEGNIVDYAALRGHINERARLIGMPREIGFDPYAARQFCEVDLPADGFNTVPVRQGFISLSEPTKKLLSLVVDGKFHHGGNPIARWNADNCVAATDPAGNIKLDKGKANGRIDGMAAAVNGISRMSLYSTQPPSVYETRGLRTL